MLWLIALIPFLPASLAHARNCRSTAQYHTLFSKYFDSKFRQDSVQAIIAELANIDCKGFDSVLYRFSETNSHYRRYSLEALSKLKSPFYIDFLNQHSDSLDVATLSYCILGLSDNDPWMDDRLLASIVSIATSNPITGARVIALTYLSDVARYNDCLMLMRSFDLEIDNLPKMWISRTILRYHSADLDQKIRQIFKGILNTDEFFYSCMKKFNRYDFLPDLYTLQTRLKNENNPLRKAAGEKILITLKEVIPYLEKKKAENAEIGLPLDWGTTNSVRKEL
jgi:hypothetical protein